MQLSDILRRPVPSLRELATAWLGSRRALVITGIAIVVAGMALGWHWLSAIGIAPVILSLAPCAAMCALGACAMMKGASFGAKPDSGKTDLPNDGSASAQSGEAGGREDR
jgi:hypothetical protein